jgi:hypothetical protein
MQRLSRIFFLTAILPITAQEGIAPPAEVAPPPPLEISPIPSAPSDSGQKSPEVNVEMPEGVDIAIKGTIAPVAASH